MLKLYLAVATCVLLRVSADEPKLKQFFGNDYQLAVPDNEDLGKILTKLGVAADKIEIIKSNRPTVELTYNEATGEYTLNLKEAGELSHPETFQLGQDTDVVKYSLPGKSTFEVFGEDTLKDTLKFGDKTVVITWKFSADKLHCTVEHDGTVANREFNLKPEN